MTVCSPLHKQKVYWSKTRIIIKLFLRLLLALLKDTPAGTWYAQE